MTAVVAADLIGRAEEYLLIDTNILTEFTIAAQRYLLIMFTINDLIHKEPLIRLYNFNARFQRVFAYFRKQ